MTWSIVALDRNSGAGTWLRHAPFIKLRAIETMKACDMCGCCGSGGRAQ